MSSTKKNTENRGVISVTFSPNGHDVAVRRVNLYEPYEDFAYPRFKGHRLVYFRMAGVHRITHYATGVAACTMETTDMSKERFFQYALERFDSLTIVRFEEEINKMKEKMGPLYPANVETKKRIKPNESAPTKLD